jgi:putative sigma-54 modulation protein
MQVEIRAKGFALTEGIRSHIERRLGFALDRFTSRLRAVLVWVGDINGPKGGAQDKCCRMVVQLTHGRVVLEERADDLYAAIDRAAHRAGKTIARKAKRANRPVSPRLQMA